MLLALDNFETQLEAVAGDSGYACADPEWDRLLEHLADRLPGTASRLALTTRHRLATLSPPERALTVPLGPLPMAEAALFLQDSPALRRLAFGDDEGWALARRLLAVSRGHPLILTRLGTLADDRKALDAALAKLETGGLGRLPDVFTAGLSEAQREKERRYLEDVAVRSVDLLLERLTPDARRLLWVVTRASEPVPEGLLEGVWSGQLEQMPPEVRARLEAEEGPAPPPVAPLLEELDPRQLVAAAGRGGAAHVDAEVPQPQGQALTTVGDDVVDDRGERVLGLPLQIPQATEVVGEVAVGDGAVRQGGEAVPYRQGLALQGHGLAAVAALVPEIGQRRERHRLHRQVIRLAENLEAALEQPLGLVETVPISWPGRSSRPCARRSRRAKSISWSCRRASTRSSSRCGVRPRRAAELPAQVTCSARGLPAAQVLLGGPLAEVQDDVLRDARARVVAELGGAVAPDRTLGWR